MTAQNRKSLRRKDMAALAGVAVQTVGKWIKRGCPVNEDGTLDADEVLRWRDANARGDRALTDPRSTSDIDRIGDIPEDALDDKRKAVKWNAEFRKQKALAEQIKVRQLLRELIEIDEHKRILVARAATFRQELLALPKRMAHQLHSLSPQQVHERLDLECRRILKSLIEAPTIEDPGADDADS